VVNFCRIKEKISDYPDPTFEEMLRLCTDLGLVSEYTPRLTGVTMRCINQVFDVSVDEAEILMQGLLLGFFYSQSQDDLSLALWE